MLRTSSHTIYVDLPKEPEEMLLVHGYTGAYDKVSRLVATYLRSLEPKNPPKPLYGDWSPEPTIEGEVVSPSAANIELLKRRGYLTEKTISEEQESFVKMVTTLHKYASRLMPNYVLMPTYSCNLRCPYCFQDHMRTDPAYKHLLRVIQPSTIDRIFAAMPQIEALHGVTPDMSIPRNITFFGGEPLLMENHASIEYIVNKALSLGSANFSAITNGTDLEHYRDLLGQDRISALQITLDGPSYAHDKRRIYADGRGSFEKIANNISMALDLGVLVNIRINVDRLNIDRLPALAEELSTRGWTQSNLFSVGTSVVTSGEPNSSTSVKTTFSSWELDLALDSMRDKYPVMKVIRRPDDNLMTNIRQIFEGRTNPLSNFSSSFCGAHNKMYVLDPFGDIYACWERTGDPKIRIGYINENCEVIFNEELKQTWRNRTVVTNPTCRQCRYSLYCGGGCASLAMSHKGKFHTNFCDGFGHRFRASAAQAYRDYINGAEMMSIHKDICNA
jgi:uncharacterized protein